MAEVFAANKGAVLASGWPELPETLDAAGAHWESGRSAPGLQICCARTVRWCVAQMKLYWQSKFVLLVVLPFVGASVVLQTRWWAVNAPPVAIWTVGVSLLLALVVFQLRAATPGAAFAGAAITASLMFSTALVPYMPWQTALMPVIAVFALTYLATRLGRRRKELLGTAEGRHGRSASQVAANLGVAALVSDGLVQSMLTDSGWFTRATFAPMPLFAVGLAALAEAAADTVSSEIGPGAGRPAAHDHHPAAGGAGHGRSDQPGRHLAGMAAAGMVAGAGTLALRGDWACSGSVLRAGRLRLVLRQPAGSNAGTARLAEQRRGEFFVDRQRGGVCAGRDGSNGSLGRALIEHP